MIRRFLVLAVGLAMSHVGSLLSREFWFCRGGRARVRHGRRLHRRGRRCHSHLWNPGFDPFVATGSFWVGRLDGVSYRFPSSIATLAPDSAGLSMNFASAAYNFKAMGNRHVAVAASVSTLYDFDLNLKILNADNSVDQYKDRGKMSQVVWAAPSTWRRACFGDRVVLASGVIATDQTNAGSSGTTAHADWTFEGNPMWGRILWDLSTKIHLGALSTFRLSSMDVKYTQTQTAPSGTQTVSSATATFGLPGSWGLGA